MNELVVKGSLLDVSRDSDPTMALMSAKLVLLCDRSGSMTGHDSDGKERYLVEDKVVEDFQGKYPGKVAIVPFSDDVYISLNGTLPHPDGETNIGMALQFVKPIVEAGIHIVLISDGEPTDYKPAIMDVARDFRGFLDTVFIGKKGDPGDLFLKELSKVAGGTHETNEATKLLERTLTRLMLKAGS